MVKNPPAMQETSCIGKFPWRRDRLPTPVFMGFPGGSDGKESAFNVGDLGSVPGWGRSPGGGHSNPLQYSCLENPHGQKGLVGCSPWGCRELDTTEQLSTRARTHTPPSKYKPFTWIFHFEHAFTLLMIYFGEWKFLILM